MPTAMRCIPRELTGFQKYILDNVLIDACSHSVTGAFIPTTAINADSANYRLRLPTSDPGLSAPTHLVTRFASGWQCEVTTLRHLGLEGLENYTDARCVGFRDNKGSVRC